MPSPNDLVTISEALQNPVDEGERLIAFADLKEYLAAFPDDEDANNLYDKYSKLGTDWRAEIKSPVDGG